MQVRWTPDAIEDLQQIHDFIARDSPRYASIVVERLLASVDQLATFPLSGRILPERPADSLRELIRPPYRIVYRFASDTVHVLTVFRASKPFS